ncbi:MAG TPA: MgtC/SapB family protein [Thermoanaerobaculia bacterium]|nr:MgtC/SapB family protein [Thermoanaerobaculia bacterium]
MAGPLLLRLVVSAVLGSLVGLERERGEWAAGLRTHMLVCLGSCLFMIVSAWGFSGVLGRPAVVLDPSRIAAQVVTGVGFLGAGTILLRGSVVRGLTTAASLWAVAAVGLATGGGLYEEAVAATVLIVLILAGIKPIERKLFASRQPRSISLTVDPSRSPVDAIEKAVREAGVVVSRMVVRHGAGVELDAIDLSVSGASPRRIEALAAALRALAGVRDLRIDAASVESWPRPVP